MLFALDLAKLHQLGYFSFWLNNTYGSYDNVIQVEMTIKLQVFHLGLIP